MAGVAIVSLLQRYSLRHFDHVVILKTLGATPNGIDGLFMTIFVTLGIAATFLGSAVGYGTQIGVVSILQPYIPIELPAPGIQPILLGLITGFVCLFVLCLTAAHQTAGHRAQGNTSRFGSCQQYGSVGVCMRRARHVRSYVVVQPVTFT